MGWIKLYGLLLKASMTSQGQTCKQMFRTHFSLEQAHLHIMWWDIIPEWVEIIYGGWILLVISCPTFIQIYFYKDILRLIWILLISLVQTKIHCCLTLSEQMLNKSKNVLQLLQNNCDTWFHTHIQLKIICWATGL